MGKPLFPAYTPPPSTQATMNARNAKIDAQIEATKPVQKGGADITVPTTANAAANQNIADAVQKMSQMEKVNNAMDDKTPRVGGRRSLRRRRTLRRRRRTFRRRRRR
jgi:hypothetical protein